MAKKALLRARRLITRTDEIMSNTMEEGINDEPIHGSLVVAQNVAVDNNGKVMTRYGVSQVQAAATHSLYVHPKNDSIAYYMIGSTLYLLNADYTGTAVTTFTTDNELSYDLVGDEIVLTNGIVIGFVAGTTFDTFNQTTGQFEELMDAGQFIVYDDFDNTLLVARNNIVSRSKPYNPQVLDRRYSDFPVLGNITMLGIVEDGWYIGTENGVAFIERSTGASQSIADNDGFIYKDISSVGPINGAFTHGYDYNDKTRSRFAAWASKDGILVGRAGGTVENLSYPNVAIPHGTSGKLFYREINGVFQFIAVIRELGDSYAPDSLNLAVNEL